VGVAAWVQLEKGVCINARIVLGAVAPTPIIAEAAGLAMTGTRPDDKVIAKVARTAAGEAKPISDLRGSAAYRTELVRVLTERAVKAALERAASAGGRQA